MGRRAITPDAVAPNLHAAALAADAAGLCVLPPREDGSKAPIGAWKAYQTERPVGEQIAAWYAGGRRSGIGYVCGAVSGDLECFEFDCPDTYRAYHLAAETVGLGPLVERVAAGYEEATPGGGVHWLWRCNAVSGNTELAKRPKRPDDVRLAGDGWTVLIETRGRGGYVVAAPSFGTVHPTGRPYRLRRGGVATIVDVTPAERAELWALARTFDRTPPDPPREPAGPPGGRPGDDFAAGTAWSAILEPHGWTLVYERGGEAFWRRPGKDRGVSATTDYAGSELLYVFTSSSVFAANRSYSKFGAYAVLNHEGDFAKAARALAGRGFGKGSPATGSSVEPSAAPLPPVPDFPLDVLPPAARRYVAEAADAVGVPPEMVALPLFVFAGACIGRTRRIVLKRGFVQRPILWGAVVARPGSAKSPALAAAQAPIDALQAEAVDRWERAKEDYEAELERWKGEVRDKGAKPAKPILQHFLTTDATKEALADITKYAPGVAVVRDELTAWVGSFDAYRGGGKNKGSDRQDFLSLWAGAGLKVDRKSADTLYVPEPTVGVVGGIQPDLLPSLAHEAGQDGFVDRFLWAYPDTDPAGWTEDAVSEDAERDLLALFRKLRRPTDPGDGGTTQPSPEARVTWREWYDQNQMLTATAPPGVAGVYSKLPNQAARLALVLHCLWHPDDPAKPVERERIEDAIALAEYFRAHAHRVLLHFGASPMPCFAGLPARVLRALESVCEGGGYAWAWTAKPTPAT